MIIGITGAAGAGKNTLADLIQQQYPEYDFQIVAYATKVKQVYTVITGETVQDTPEWKAGYLPYWGMTRRTMLQRIGTDCMRDHLDTDVWVKSLFAEMDPNKNYLITDVRFPNEVRRILQERDSIVIRVVRPTSGPIKERHRSEEALNNYEFPEIINAGEPSFMLSQFEKIWK
jgi:hypothetical protein